MTDKPIKRITISTGGGDCPGLAGGNFAFSEAFV